MGQIMPQPKDLTLKDFNCSQLLAFVMLRTLHLYTGQALLTYPTMNP